MDAPFEDRRRKMIAEILGYIGMTLLLCGYMVKNRGYLHLLLTIGCIVMVIYAIALRSIPFTGLNVVAFVINLKQYIKYKK
jgi:membrane-bound ClpP family serine protease